MTDRYELPHPIGMGGVALGNEFRVTTDRQAADTLEAAWEAGIRYFDVAPHYGVGLAERRYGQFLHHKPRESFVLSSKVGRLLKAGPEHRNQQLMPYSPSPNIEVYDYSREGTLRSIEDTLQRTGLDSLDVVFVHDLSPDNGALPKDWLELWPEAVEGCFATLSELRDQGVIKAWGMGVNRPEPILKSMEDSDPDLHLMASQYSLVEHDHAVETVFPAARKHGNSFVIGSALNAGFLAGLHRYHYGDKNSVIAKERMEKRDRLREVAFDHGVNLLAAALQFAKAPDVVQTVVVGLGRPDEAIDDVAAMNMPIPAEFWQDLRGAGLIHKDAPVPG
ncbi:MULTISPECIES: aldo/keto reductase [Thioclava]|uniref:aldo/keto reductase n=1 Tax=Thioclava TaxID=285107 RepID=UPI000B53F37D|nr:MULTISPECIES: aldo/keto reductase [Thioclava]OWY12085.1 L-fucose dehydrogenase [Thioclava sp. F34-6]WGT49712.1 aldo/keto reductase [Thioclava nitratireducens]